MIKAACDPSMKKIRLMHAKLHRVRVTATNINYMGSITIDQALLAMVGILPLEAVEVINLSNGQRWSTYVLPGDANRGEICPNGGGALLCEQGDTLIIYALEERDRADVLCDGHQALVLFSDEHNKCQKVVRQTVHPQGNSIEFQTSLIMCI
jgi:aspartate 1-decarboxylase